MRVLCCLDGTNVGPVKKATEILSSTQPLTLGLLYVIDLGPRKDIEHTRERFFRPHDLPRQRDDEMHQADHSTASKILREALNALPDGEVFEREGRPEREIVNAAAEWEADLVMICPRIGYGGRPVIGPKSVGHVARFVVDHAPCPVLVVRPLAREQFPIER
jgi:nucleotide-binding universal stress UspA family protein